jgi:hypothetical protein
MAAPTVDIRGCLQRVGSSSTNGEESMRLRFRIDRRKAIQALVWAIFSMAWAAVGTSVAVHFH